MQKFFFKKTMSGMVLMVYERRPSNGFGDFYWMPCKATEEDANNFAKELAVLAYKEEIIDNIKKTNPELLI